MIPFELSEYRERLRRVTLAMDDRGIDALVVSDPANMCYLSGYEGWSFYVPQALVVVGGETEPYWIGRPQDAAGARLTTWLSDTNIRSYPEAYIQHAVDHPIDAIADLLADQGFTHSSIGVELDSYYFSGFAWDRIRSRLPEASFQDATLLVRWCRIVKSQAELAYMRKAGLVASRAMRVAASEIAPGVRECHAAAMVVAAEFEGTAEICPDYPAIVPLMPSGARAAASHLSWTDRCYEEGDAVSVELAGCVKRYHAPFSRTIVVRTPPPAIGELSRVVVEGIEAALDVFRPGATCEEVEDAWTAVLRRHGEEKESRLGYAVGIGFPPDWGEHTASIRAGDRTVLQEGMTFHLIAGMWKRDLGFEMSETVAVTATGCEVLTDFPRGLVAGGGG